MKGVGKLIEVFALKGDKLKDPDVSRYKDSEVKKHKDNEIPSMAIIPFSNKGADEDAFYAYGISSDLISACSSAGLIRVASLSDVEKLDFINLRNEEIAEKLLVRYVAQGLLWKMGEKFQLSIELYDTKQKKVLWSDRWQESWNNLTSIEEKLKEGLLKVMNMKSKTDSKSNQINPTAYELYLKGKFRYENRKDKLDIEVAKGLFEEAYSLDNNLTSANFCLANIYVNLGNRAKALKINNKIIKTFKNKKDSVELAKAYFNTSILLSNSDESLKNIQKAYDLFKKLNNKILIASCYHRLGNLHKERGDFEKAKTFKRKYYNIARKLDDKNLMLESKHDIAMDAWFDGDLDKSIYHFKNALKIAIEIENRGMEAHIYHSMYAPYVDKGQRKTAMMYLKKALVIYKQLGGKGNIIALTSDIGINYFDAGKFDKSEGYLIESIRLANEIGEDEIKSENTLADVYLHTGRLDKGYNYLNKLLKRSENIKDLIAISALNWSLSWYYLYDYNFEKALSCAKIAHKGFTDFEWENIVNRVNLVLGYIYYKKKKLKEAQMYIEFALNFFNGSSKIGNAYFKSVILLNIINKQLGSKVEIDNEETLIKKNHSMLDHDGYFLLYTLYDKDSYLKKAMEAINKIVKNLKEDEKEVFLNYPYIASINGRYKEVFNNG
ncbi:MAG: tetratricopeptide repeat protein [Candidatus Neomarinimicrobiota bacterium]